MTSTYSPKHFQIHELVHHYYWDKYGKSAIEFLDQDLVRDLDLLRSLTGKKITVNDYFWGGSFKSSGLRYPGYSVGATDSMHYFGNAFDVKVEGMTSAEVYEFILMHDMLFTAISRLENPKHTPTWTHIDSKPTIYGMIYTFIP